MIRFEDKECIAGGVFMTLPLLKKSLQHDFLRYD